LKTRPTPPDRYALYEASVLSVDFDVDFVAKTFKKLRGRPAKTMREDFAGTAATAGEWVMRDKSHHAFAVDLDPEPFAWAQRHRIPVMRDAAKRLTLVTADVRTVDLPPADLVMAFNFSFWIFKQRAELLRYFKSARRGLTKQGMMVLNTYGGPGATKTLVERKRISGRRTIDGVAIPAFHYVWDQESFNPVTNEIFCSIHFDLRGRPRMKRAFTYDWRAWSLPELRELILEAGFRDVQVWTDGWDDKTNEPDNKYKLRTYFENDEAWLAYVIGVV
jgi:hypothetical protein